MNSTLCMTCEQEIGVAPDWNRRHAGQTVDWKVARHRRVRSGEATHLHRQIPICPGSGVVVHPNAVIPRRLEVPA